MIYEQINKCINKEEAEMFVEVKNIYAEIASEIVAKPRDTIVRNFAMAESRAMNNYCMSFVRKIEQKCKDIMLKIGMSEEFIEITWSKVRLAAGMPKIELCKEIPFSDENVAEKPKQKESQKNERKYGAKITVSGVAMEVIGWIVIPGMKAIAAITKTLGIVLIVAGAYVIYSESKKSEPKIKLNAAVEKNRTKEFVGVIVDKQYELNTKIISSWLKKIGETMCKECTNVLDK